MGQIILADLCFLLIPRKHIYVVSKGENLYYSVICIIYKHHSHSYQVLFLRYTTQLWQGVCGIKPIQHLVHIKFEAS